MNDNKQFTTVKQFKNFYINKYLISILGIGILLFISSIIMYIIGYKYIIIVFIIIYFFIAIPTGIYNIKIIRRTKNNEIDQLDLNVDIEELKYIERDETIDLMNLLDLEYEVIEYNNDKQILDIYNEYKKDLNYTPIIIDVNYKLVACIVDNINNIDNIKNYAQYLLKKDYKECAKVLKIDTNKNINSDNECDYVDCLWIQTLKPIITKIPTNSPWQALAYIPINNFNYWPDTYKLLCLSKLLYDKYNFVPLLINHNKLQFYREDIIKDEKTTLEIAKLVYSITPVYKNANISIESLANSFKYNNLVTIDFRDIKK